ncbi:MAG: 50S ribosomal protein L9 [Muribaculaceae bacterium]|nr:50S ribosomal protein L9 [Muribaculaceae bacterium]
MKIILKEDVNGLGYKDDVVEVKNGYGRNYLIPTGKAIIATESALKVLAENQRQRAHKLAKIKADAEAAAAALEGLQVVIPAKAAENGAIYGSVGAAQIAEALEKLGHNIDRKIIEVAAAKVLGSHTAKVRFHREVVVELPFEVVALVEEA